MKKTFGPARSAWLLALGIALAGFAQAGPITETFSATISAGTDSGNLFGGGSLVGDTILMSFSYDPSLMYSEGGPSADIYISSNVATASASFQIGNNPPLEYTNASGFTQAVLQPAGGGAELNLDFFGPSVFFMMFSSSPAWTPGDEASQSAMDAFIANQIPIEDSFNVGNDSFQISSLSPASASTPEPASILSLGLGLAFVAYRRRSSAA